MCRLGGRHVHETRGDRRLPEPGPSPCAAGCGPGAGSATRHETPPLSVVFNWGYTKRPTCLARAERTLCKENRALPHVRSSRDHAAARCAPGPHAGRSGVGVDLGALGVDPRDPGVDLRALGVDLGWGGGPTYIWGAPRGCRQRVSRWRSLQWPRDSRL